eukprot:sb/3462816/
MECHLVRVSPYTRGGEGIRFYKDMKQPFTVDFKTNVFIGSGNSCWKPFYGFFWEIEIGKTDEEHTGVYLGCKPIDSTNQWSCTVHFSLQNIDTGRVLKSHTDSIYSSTNTGGRGWPKFEPFDSNKKEYRFRATIDITDSFIGTPILVPLGPGSTSEVVVFRRHIKETEPPVRYYSSHQANGRLWVVESYRTESHLKLKNRHDWIDTYEVNWKINAYNTKKKTGDKEELLSNVTPVTILIESDSSNRGIFQTTRDQSVLNGTLRSTLSFSGDQTTEGKSRFTNVNVMFIINDPDPQEEGLAIPGPANFGREYLDLPAHHKSSFTLKDGTTIPLNSYIIAKNSPVLKNIIEKEGELDHDMSDFEAESVRIFADICYSGTFEKLTDTTEFKVFSDLVKMVGVFKVDWAKDGCMEFYKHRLPNSVEDVSAYWDFGLLATDSSIKFGNHEFLIHLLSTVPKTTDVIQFHFSKLLLETTKRSHLDLIMVLACEFGLAVGLLQQLQGFCMIGHKIPLLEYFLENFNFSLCEEQLLTLLSVALGKCKDAKYVLNFTNAVKAEKEKDPKKSVKPIQLPADGTLSNLARNHWNRISNTTWPCSQKRPFCLVKRKLEKDGEGEKKTEKDGEGEKETEKDGDCKKRKAVEEGENSGEVEKEKMEQEQT